MSAIRHPPCNDTVLTAMTPALGGSFLFPVPAPRSYDDARRASNSECRHDPQLPHSSPPVPEWDDKPHSHLCNVSEYHTSFPSYSHRLRLPQSSLLKPLGNATCSATHSQMKTMTRKRDYKYYQKEKNSKTKTRLEGAVRHTSCRIA